MFVPGGGGGTYWPGQFDHALVNTYINTGGGVQQGTFRVDMDQIPGLIAKYKDARDKLADIAVDARFLQTIDAPGNDEVSEQMTRELARKAGVEQGSLVKAVNDGIERLNDQINQLEEARANYDAAEEAATARTL
ncbi:hypothetical protein [Haloactinomyces albus]|uniref:PE family protein n=1 Tax=Haloactinomyces albus TaxID=1352928 RepID=A0AAE3ZCS6_9ACTN|nr:hypothetical protein [Haloactinomyces albus]MDR7301500.1 hypothetical protein [Haloactinomyces albus]